MAVFFRVLKMGAYDGGAIEDGGFDGEMVSRVARAQLLWSETQAGRRRWMRRCFVAEIVEQARRQLSQPFQHEARIGCSAVTTR